ncbi:MAG TPA: hypothetical protein VNW95_09260 [Mucilaginibacter sp.]|jgi:hypothetical protein|nr:hypothetical protein [Mucilaginibacter sp.]
MIIIDGNGNEYNIEGKITISFPELKKDIPIESSTGQLGHMLNWYLENQVTWVKFENCTLDEKG